MTKEFWSKYIEIVPQGNLSVYETERTETAPDKLLELSKRFEVGGKIKPTDDMSVILQKRKVLALYNNTGAFFYGDFSKLHNHQYRPELPSKEEATEIATDYLKTNKWMPENLVLDGAYENLFERAEGEKREKKTEWTNSISVDFRYSLDKLKTYGPGAKVKVSLGHKGEVIGFFGAMPSFFRHAEFPALSREELEEILHWKLRFPLKNIGIRDVKLAYHAESCVRWRRFLQPTYVFEITSTIEDTREKRKQKVNCELHPIPATMFAPRVSIKAPSYRIQTKSGEPLTLSYDVRGGNPPFKASWESNFDGHLSDEHVLNTRELSVAHRDGRVTSHTIKLTVTDRLGMQDSHKVLVKVVPSGEEGLQAKTQVQQEPEDPFVGVEWCNIYHGFLADISGTDDSAQGFKDRIRSLPNWTSRFDWGNDSAWEQDFKYATAPGGGTDSYYADNIHFAFFAGHGSSGRFYFGSTVDDHIMRAQDAQWGDGSLNWVVLHACETMRSNFAWDVWCDAFKGLHQMFGFHTTTQGSTPP